MDKMLRPANCAFFSLRLPCPRKPASFILSEKNLAQIQDNEQELRELVKEMRQEHKEEMRTLRNWVTEVISGYKKTA